MSDAPSSIVLLLPALVAVWALAGTTDFTPGGVLAEATLKDRVVQMALKRLLEPIWESDFLDCSNGFRPGRRTMDCIRVCQSRITTQNKYLWVIEGDITGCFDHVQHTILLKLVKRRVRDQRVTSLLPCSRRA